MNAPTSRLADERLKPKACPFCGNDNPEVGYEGFCDPRYHVKCYVCPVTVNGDSEENAVERWNRRAAESADTKRLDYLINWLGFNEDVNELPVRDWVDREDARTAIDAAIARQAGGEGE